MKIIITEKPSVARQFAAALNVSGNRDGYIENSEWIITWAVGHLVTLSYPEKYDERYKKWNLADLPFLPSDYKYEVISSAAKQFKVIKSLFSQSGITVYNAGDSGREGEYIQRLILQETHCKAPVKRVWINSQTDDEILRGIREAKDSKEYDNLAASAYMRGIEDYAVGINFSRLLSLKFGYELNNKIKSDKYIPIAVGRVMTCVLAMIVERERAILGFKATDYYKLQAEMGEITAQWKACEPSAYVNSSLLYDDTGFKAKKDADAVLVGLNKDKRLKVASITAKDEKKQAPLLFNLAELQSTCSKALKMSPSETLEAAQRLYEAKLTTYPRTDARVLSSAVAKEIGKNLTGLARGSYHNTIAQNILTSKLHHGIEKTRYTDDKKITDHYAIIPTGSTFELSKMSEQDKEVYYMVVDRFLSIFLPAAIYKKFEAVFLHSSNEPFYSSDKILIEKGWLSIYDTSKEHLSTPLSALKKGAVLDAAFAVKTATTTPPKRYTSGSLILAMENAGKLIEDEDLREQIKGSGIGTSATRADTIKKLVSDKYISLNNKTQVVTPTEIGFEIYDIVKRTIPTLLNPEMTASWEKGLSGIERGEISADTYRVKLEEYIRKQTDRVMKMTSEGAPAGERVMVGECPVCGEPVYQTKKGGYICSGWKKEGNGCFFGAPEPIVTAMTKEQKAEFIRTGNSGLVNGIKSKKGSTYSTVFRINDEKTDMTYDYDAADGMNGPKEEFDCPRCGKKLKSNKYSLNCGCGFKCPHIVGDKSLDSKHIRILLSGGWTPLIEGLKSKKGSTYSAFLKLKEDGSIEMSFDKKK